MTQLSLLPRFDGKSFDFALDGERLGSQFERVKALMSDGHWRTLPQIVSRIEGASEAGVSARLRDLRKPRNGGYTVLRRRVEGLEARGIHEYRVTK